MRFLPIAALFALAACSQNAPSPKAQVAAAEASLTAAGQIVLACYAVPACSAKAPKLQIKIAFDTAYTAVTAAQAQADAGQTPDMTSVTAGLAQLQQMLLALPQGGK